MTSAGLRPDQSGAVRMCGRSFKRYVRDGVGGLGSDGVGGLGWAPHWDESAVLLSYTHRRDIAAHAMTASAPNNPSELGIREEYN
eukprot:6359335-Amphidinium_carterae.1